MHKAFKYLFPCFAVMHFICLYVKGKNLLCLEATEYWIYPTEGTIEQVLRRAVSDLLLPCQWANPTYSKLTFHSCSYSQYAGARLGVRTCIYATCIGGCTDGITHTSYFLAPSCVYRSIFAVGTILLEALKYPCLDYWRKEMWRLINTLWQ